LLLAYYIAAVNIETTYLGMRREIEPDTEYASFSGLILTDTFQSWEDDDRPDLDVFPENNERLERLKKLPITVIVGNPPYSVGQESANDYNQNERYEHLDASIAQTYAAASQATLLRNLYDSYVRAIKWATLRIKERGVIAFVTNGGFIDSNSFDGMRKTLAEEFSAIHVFNLRGNQRTAGEQSRREGGKIFDSGSRATVAITVFVKNPEMSEPATIYYADVGDYLTREEKLAKVAASVDVFGLEPMLRLTPNAYGDWIYQRRDDFMQHRPLRGEGGIFETSSLGVSTNRDAWVVNSSAAQLEESVERIKAAFNAGISAKRAIEDFGAHEISWSRSLRARYEKARQLPSRGLQVRQMVYRPFFRQWFADERPLIEARGSTPSFFTVAGQKAIAVLRPNDRTPFAVLAIDSTPNLALFMDPADVFPATIGEDAPPPPREREAALPLVFDAPDRGNISTEALSAFRDVYGDAFTEDDVYCYIYGLLHSPEYRETYAADLKRMSPRIPLVDSAQPFVDAGRALSELHLGYEAVPPYPLEGLDVEPRGDPYAYFKVEKMTYAKTRVGDKLVLDKSAIKYNAHITLGGIPAEAYRYMLGSRSAIDWIVDRYQVRTDSGSGIVNDPNEWSRSVGDPRYIIDLFARIVTLSLRTMQIVDSLPPLVVR
jgi:predicted helicase